MILRYALRATQDVAENCPVVLAHRSKSRRTVYAGDVNEKSNYKTWWPYCSAEQS